MSSYPKNPAQVATDLVRELEQGLIVAEEMLGHLDLMAQNLEDWRARLKATQSSDHNSLSSEEALKALQAASDGIDLLRDYTVTRSGETRERALSLIGKASVAITALDSTARPYDEERGS